MFLLFSFVCCSISLNYRECEHRDDGACENCTLREWDPTSSLIPCSQLGREFRICTSKGLDKFQMYFPDVSPPPTGDGCEKRYNNINSFGKGVCKPTNGVVCLGERYWIVYDNRCFQEGKDSYLSVLLCSLFFGIFGVDRFLLGYILLGTLKLLTFGGFGLWYLVDLVLVSLGKIDPKMSDFRNSY